LTKVPKIRRKDSLFNKCWKSGYLYAKNWN
jgi:hypothetical protein